MPIRFINVQRITLKTTTKFHFYISRDNLKSHKKKHAGPSVQEVVHCICNVHLT